MNRNSRRPVLLATQENSRLLCPEQPDPFEASTDETEKRITPKSDITLDDAVDMLNRIHTDRATLAFSRS